MPAKILSCRCNGNCKSCRCPLKRGRQN
jgi:hypothetical protein